ncbi:hypothetical protein F9288_05750 [Sphingomonas sp. CL5.1]|uniref:hypothetical protein n=1 Tax=Sphingomonas sp. CL5.1 TaxID=2653203 RepID=UPI001583A956|nr:hypothetical protein [Sphingomonas sp. CL5.1]QKR99209.1 hypothetical protein F9288_05750 [Sphingomonas sp. CL5.1]
MPKALIPFRLLVSPLANETSEGCATPNATRQGTRKFALAGAGFTVKENADRLARAQNLLGQITQRTKMGEILPVKASAFVVRSKEAFHVIALRPLKTRDVAQQCALLVFAVPVVDADQPHTDQSPVFRKVFLHLPLADSGNLGNSVRAQASPAVTTGIVYERAQMLVAVVMGNGDQYREVRSI